MRGATSLFSSQSSPVLGWTGILIMQAMLLWEPTNALYILCSDESGNASLSSLEAEVRIMAFEQYPMCMYLNQTIHPGLKA